MEDVRPASSLVATIIVGSGRGSNMARHFGQNVVRAGLA
jgi:hypothetical protein